MGMRHVEDMVITVGEWQDPQTGETRYRNMTIGRVFERDNGSRVSRIDCLPAGEAGKYWNGYVNYYPKRERS